MIIFIGELLLDYVLSHFEDACENLTLIKQVILQCCTCLISLGVLRIEDIANNNLFQVWGKKHIYFYLFSNLKFLRFSKICLVWNIGSIGFLI